MTESEQETNHSRKFGKKGLNFTIDFVACVLMLQMIGTGLVIRYVLPPGSGGRGGGYGLTLWGMDRHDWGGVHFWLAVFLLALLVLHIALHWSWVCNFVRRRVARDRPHGRLSQRAAIASGVVFFVLLNVLIVWFLWASDSNVFAVADSTENIRSKDHELVEPKLNHGRRARKRASSNSTFAIQGFMTLKEVSNKTGVPVDTIKESLRLPENVSSRAHLGRLKRRYGFQIEDVRRIVAKHHR